MLCDRDRLVAEPVVAEFAEASKRHYYYGNFVTFLLKKLFLSYWTGVKIADFYVSL